jgi:hypothetical protein
MAKGARISGAETESARRKEAAPAERDRAGSQPDTRAEAEPEITRQIAEKIEELIEELIANPT